MELRGFKPFLTAIGYSVVIYAVIFTLMHVIGADLIKTPRTQRFFSPKPDWIACATLGGWLGLVTRSRLIVVAVLALLWALTAPVLMWSGPTEEGNIASSLVSLLGQFYLAGFVAYAALIFRLLPRYQTLPVSH
ncbi:MAG: hypothetical protein WCK51_10145 [Armatimonadota bacterium]